jgi:cytosine permease
MNSLTEATQEFECSPVPDSDTVSGWQISLVKVGGVIALPAFVLGAELGASLGLVRAFYSMAVGGLILTAVAALTGTVAARSRLTTTMLTQFAFGRLGSRVVNAVLVITMLGWFGVTASLFGVSLDSAIGRMTGVSAGATPYTILGSLLVIATTVFGFSALKKLAELVVPMLVLFLVTIDSMAMRQTSWGAMLASRGTGTSFGLAVSAVVGGLIVAATVFPDMCRFARSPGDGRLAAVMGFAAAVPVVLIMTTIPSVATGKKDLITVMLDLRVAIPAFCVIVFAAWTTNSTNLYSSSLGLSVIFPRVARWRLCIVAGAAGTAMAVSGILDHFIPFLILLSITIPPIAGIYVADFFFVRRGRYDVEDLVCNAPYSVPAFTAWILATTFARLTSKGILTATGISALDAVIVAFGAYAAIMLPMRRAGASGLGRHTSSPRSEQ